MAQTNADDALDKALFREFNATVTRWREMARDPDFRRRLTLFRDLLNVPDRPPYSVAFFTLVLDEQHLGGEVAS